MENRLNVKSSSSTCPACNHEHAAGAPQCEHCGYRLDMQVFGDWLKARGAKRRRVAPQRGDRASGAHGAERFSSLSQPAAMKPKRSSMTQVTQPPIDSFQL